MHVVTFGILTFAVYFMEVTANHLVMEVPTQVPIQVLTYSREHLLQINETVKLDKKLNHVSPTVFQTLCKTVN